MRNSHIKEDLRVFTNMKFCLLICVLWAFAYTSTYGCTTLTEGSETVVDCSDVSDISEVVAFMGELDAAGRPFHNRFRLKNNPNVDSLVDGLFGNIQFTTVEVSNCPNLNYVGDFLGASSATLTKLDLHSINISSIPALNAPTLLDISISPSSSGSAIINIERSAFTRMKNIEIIYVMIAYVHPWAFYDLKNLRKVDLGHTHPSFKNLTADTLRVHSDALSYVDLQYTRFTDIEYGSIEGFPFGAEIRFFYEHYYKKEAFLNHFIGGGRLVVHRPTACGCEVAWIRLGPYLYQTFIPCARQMGPTLLQNVPESEFANCEV